MAGTCSAVVGASITAALLLVWSGCRTGVISRARAVSLDFGEGDVVSVADCRGAHTAVLQQSAVG